MDTTARVDTSTPESTVDTSTPESMTPESESTGAGVAALIDELATVDSAEAPETAARIARLLTDELDDVRGDGAAEQLSAFGGARPEA